MADKGKVPAVKRNGTNIQHTRAGASKSGEETVLRRSGRPVRPSAKRMQGWIFTNHLSCWNLELSLECGIFVGTGNFRCDACYNDWSQCYSAVINIRLLNNSVWQVQFFVTDFPYVIMQCHMLWRASAFSDNASVVHSHDCWWWVGFIVVEGCALSNSSHHLDWRRLSIISKSNNPIYKKIMR